MTHETHPGPQCPKSCTARYLCLISAVFIVYGTVIPFNFAWDAGHAAAKLANLPLNIWISPETHRRVSIPDTVQNILLFVPFGAFGVVALRRRYRALIRVAVITTAGALLSASTEALQLLTIDRTSSLTDLATNTTGTLIGAMLAPVVVAIMRRILAGLSARGYTASRALYSVVVTMVLLLIAAWHPFDASLDVGVLWPKLNALVRDPWQFGVAADEALDFLRYALFGVAFATWLREVGVRRPALLGAAAGLVVAVAFELGQLIIQSRMPGLKDIIVHTAGATTGVMLAVPATVLWPPVLGVALVGLSCVAGAAMQMLSPFEWTHSPRAFQWMPFLSYYQYTSLQTVTHVVELMLMFLPLGFVVALTIPRRAIVVVVGLTLLFVVPLEYMQGWLRGRYPDVTDIGITLLGPMAGAWLAGPGWERFERELRRSRRSDDRATLSHSIATGGPATEAASPVPRRA